MKNKYSLSLSNSLRKKINLLNSSYQQTILANLESIIYHHLLTSELEKRKEEKVIYRLNYNYKLEIFITQIICDKENVVKVLNIFDKNKLKRIIVFKEGFSAKIIDIDININREDNLINTEIINNFKSKENLKIQMEDFENKFDDFFCHSLQSLNISQTNTNKLLISLEEIDNIQKPLPLLLQGFNNTGKTTVSLIKAIQGSKENLEEKILYLSDSFSNKYHTQYLSQELLQGEKINNLIIDDFVHCIRKFAQDNHILENNIFLRSKQVNYNKFKDKFLANQEIEDIESWHLWQEIYYLIKGNQNYSKNNDYLISLEDYQQQIQAFSFLPQDINPKQIYQLAVKYQQWLTKNNYWDETDLSNYIFRNISDNFRGIYAQVYWDNIHQFNDIALKLILSLTKKILSKI